MSALWILWGFCCKHLFYTWISPLMSFGCKVSIHVKHLDVDLAYVVCLGHNRALRTDDKYLGSSKMVLLCVCSVNFGLLRVAQRWPKRQLTGMGPADAIRELRSLLQTGADSGLT